MQFTIEDETENKIQF